MAKIQSETIIEIPFYDLDPMNVVWHGNYVKYLEEARCDLFKSFNYTYMDMKEEGIIYPVAKMDLKFMKSCVFGQKIKVITSLEEIEPCVIIKYLITDANTNESILKAKSMQICVNIKTGESCYSAPEKLKKVFEGCKV